MFAGAGNDELNLQGGEAFVSGGSGFDFVIYDVYDGSGLTFTLFGTGIEGALGRGGADSFNAAGSTVAVNLIGNGGNDILIGGTLGDVITGGAGDDIMTGNGGADFFDINGAFGVDTITDFADGVDIILLGLAGVTDVSQLTITQDGMDALISFGGDSIRLSNFDSANIDNADFIFNPPAHSGDQYGAMAGADLAVMSFNDRFDFAGAQDLPLPEAVNIEAMMFSDFEAGFDGEDNAVAALNDMAPPDLGFAEGAPITYIGQYGILEIITPDDGGYWDMIA